MVRNYESGNGDNRPSKITWQKLKPSQGKTKTKFYNYKMATNTI